MPFSARVASATQQNAMQETDMALTEMELLEQNQRRLENLTGRMTTILNGFDRRLVRLESSILPIHRSTQTLSRISANINAVQKNLGENLSHYGVVIGDEPFLRQGPDPHNPWMYMEAIQRVMNERDAKSEQEWSKRMALVDMGARKVVQLVQQYTASESQTIDVTIYLSQNKPTPRLSDECITSIKALIQFLSTIPDAQNSESTFLLALQSYVRVRATYIVTSVEPITRRVAQMAESVQQESVGSPREVHAEYLRGSAPFLDWLRALVMLIESEQQSATTLFQGMSWKHMYSNIITNILQPLLTHVQVQLPVILPKLQHGLKAHRFLVLDFLGASHAALGQDCERWTSALSFTQCTTSELPDAVKSLHKSALLFFPEFLRDIKVIPVQREHEALQVNVSDIARFGMILLKGLTDYQDVLVLLFTSLGSKNWTSDTNEIYNTSLPSSSSAAQNLWSEYTRDLMAAIVSSLERTFYLLTSGAVAGISQPTVASIFLLKYV